MKNYKSKTINALYDSDLESFLKKINIFDAIFKGEKKCKYTKEVITLKNIYCVFKEGGDIKVVSDTPEAIKQFLGFLHNKK